jgi:hypothetical protein
MKPRNPPPRLTNGPVKLEVVELTGRRQWGPDVETIDLIPAGKVEVVELAGRIQQAVERFAAAWQSLSTGGFADGGTAVLQEFRESLKNPRLWPALDATGPTPPPALADQVLTTAGPQLAARWAHSLIDWQRAAAAGWLRSRWAAVWDDLPPAGQRFVVEVIDEARRAAEAKYEASLAVAARLGATVTPAPAT